MFLKNKHSSIEQIHFSEISDKEIFLFIKREDALHPFISGNKYRKLKYNLVEAFNQKKHTLVTFGGAFSNHIAAVAAAGFEYGFKTIGVIRGHELAYNLDEVLQTNPTLKFASQHNMQFHFVTRSEYREKTSATFIENLQQKFGDFYLIPEGGTNIFAVKGCEEILTENDDQYDIICSAIGTGGTISGIINSTKKNQEVIGFPSLKGDFLENEIKKYISEEKKWHINTQYHFGGYAKISEELITFINKFKSETGIPLDPVYTGKMMFGIVDLIKNDYFKKGRKILAIHTGGLQGIDGMNNVLKKKNLPQIV
ncbi:1-aminocyclopropane-1-carboxylate deaminase/D-cysteine desulfhydrase [Lutibacter sp. HS1-25]|uniref:1-aminocyclopropane-1-carboxylate deaminase/D-cysteine desulfhydrase n=1 Tax=Lutibacter sp. HS1-25 TaxID=2485000 RepID=UPI001F0CA0FC|nr:pyridoxal-phosphate dependent enzyme [Lutibacter sp. HS1-25]